MIWPAKQVVQSWHITGFLLTIFTAGFYMTGQLFYTTLIPGALVFGAGALIIRLLKKRFETSQITHLSLATAIALFFFVAFQFVAPFRLLNCTDYEKALSSTRGDLPVSSPGSESNPDIYYIILDAYARSDILQEYYQYENTEFTAYLTDVKNHGAIYIKIPPEPRSRQGNGFMQTGVNNRTETAIRALENTLK